MTIHLSAGRGQPLALKASNILKRVQRTGMAKLIILWACKAFATQLRAVPPLDYSLSLICHRVAHATGSRVRISYAFPTCMYSKHEICSKHSKVFTSSDWAPDLRAIGWSLLRLLQWCRLRRQQKPGWVPGLGACGSGHASLPKRRGPDIQIQAQLRICTIRVSRLSFCASM